MAERREWLVTNGIGGYASGTLPGVLSRRYHGLLVAALRPPLGRNLLVAKLEELARCDATAFPLSTNRWASGAIDPAGYQHIERFRLEGTTPVWTFACGGSRIEKRVWMQWGANTTFVQYTLVKAQGPLELDAKLLVDYCDFHSSASAGDWRMAVEPLTNGLRITAFEGATKIFARSASATCEVAHIWYRDFHLAIETERGLGDRADHLFAGIFRARLSVGESVTIVLSTEEAEALDGASSYKEHTAREKSLLARWIAAQPRVAPRAPSWIQQLVLAADQFIVRRALPDLSDGRSVIAGYHWFGDWGRDTMIALPGLSLVTGRPEITRKILLSFARLVDRGMLPNHFPDAGGPPEYNTVDAALWFFEATREYYAATRDRATLSILYPVLREILQAYKSGTRYHIAVEAADGLLFAGEPGVQLTWMDAKVGDHVVTPRVGKAVEVNALWYNALVGMAELARVMGQPAEDYQRAAASVKQNFAKFWNASADCCHDVIDVPGDGNDSSLRPNQIFAVSLPASPLSPEQQRKVVDVCARDLLVPHGLRSLAPGDPQYHGRYAGGPQERDAAYHQGTAWGWLLGPFVLAHLRVYQDPNLAASFLQPTAEQVCSYGLGTLGEIFDGDPPFTPRGCIAQAWTVGEILRAWHACQSFQKTTVG
ncbi:MAG TPA: amylo-alpha-1,6-glucosidase [Candidatus Dormibacteraeota bacterium]|nr:amylo-alpha-1,6-glucosidase [Candidatus Dormibacteraeota bacterium]